MGSRTLTVDVHGISDDALEGCVVEVRLDRPDIDADNVIVPVEALTDTTDVNGAVTFDLWPNVLGTSGSQYVIRIYAAPPQNSDATRGRRLMKGYFVMPDEDARLEDIVTTEDAGTTWSDAAAQATAAASVKYRGELDLAAGLPASPKAGDCYKCVGEGEVTVDAESAVPGDLIIYRNAAWEYLHKSRRILRVRTLVGTTHTLELADLEYDVLRFNTASACTLSLPAQSEVALPPGIQWIVRNALAGDVQLQSTAAGVSAGDTISGSGDLSAASDAPFALYLEAVSAGVNAYVAAGNLTTGA